LDPQGNVQAAAYDAANNPLSRTDALGNAVTFTYDTHGNLIASLDALGNKTAFTYDANGQLLSKTDAEGRTTSYTYDSNGNLIEQTDPLGKKTRFTYDAVGRRLTTTDANGFTTTAAYDTNDNVISVTDPLGNKIQNTYDGNNNRIRTVDQRGNATSFSYDANYKLVTTTNALGNKITNAYDTLRNLVSTTDPLGNVTRYTYDSENRLIATTDPSGNRTSFSYDANGNRVTVTDPLGKVTTFTFDSLNRQVGVKDALGNQSATAYDAAGRVTRKTDAGGNATSYAYDALGRQTMITDAAGGQVTFQYDKVGNRTKITDTRGKATLFTYDGMNRVLTITDPLGNVTTNRYDSVGKLAQLTDGNGNSKTYEYDGNRRQTKVTYSTGGSVTFAYDAAGNRTSMKDLVGDSTYSYDVLNRLQSYRNPWGATLGLGYDAASNRSSMQYPGGKSVQYTYDKNGRVSSVRDWNNATANYSYDAVGRLATVTYSNGQRSDYTYDAVGQNTLIAHRGPAGVLYSEATAWSPNGNPTSSDISGLTSPGLPSSGATFSYNDANQLANSTYGAPSTDKNGNISAQPEFGGVTSLTYDLNNRATGITGPSATAILKYDGDGRLAQLDIGASSRHLLLDPSIAGNRVLAELDASGGLQTGYIYGPRGLLAQAQATETFWYLHNLQGSTVAITDSGGTPLNTYTYDPFGQRLPGSSERIPNVFAFLGSFSVPTIGRFAVTAYRVYDTTAGRFTGPDPVRTGLVSGQSPYLYASNAPGGLVDPSGLFEVSASNITEFVLSHLDDLSTYVKNNVTLYSSPNVDVSFDAGNALNATGKAFGVAFLLRTLQKDLSNSNYSAGNKAQAVTFDLIQYFAGLGVAGPIAKKEAEILDVIGLTKKGEAQIEIQKANWFTGLTIVYRDPVGSTRDAANAAYQLGAIAYQNTIGPVYGTDDNPCRPGGDQAACNLINGISTTNKPGK
jgi:RHS repeat-associated protein